MALPRMVVALTSFGFVGFGLAYTLWPLPMARLTDILLPTPTARIDFAATYGGLQIGFGLFLLICVRRPAWTEPGLWAAALALSGLVLVRLQSLAAVGGQATLPIWLGLALELGAALANGIVLRRLRRGDRSGGHRVA
jgi:hypothetical protein